MAPQELVADSFASSTLALVLGARRIEHLYGVPDAWRRGVSGHLLRHAQTLSSDGLELWVFATARRSRSTKLTFAIVETADGAGNEEREPDAG